MNARKVTISINIQELKERQQNIGSRLDYLRGYL